MAQKLSELVPINPDVSRSNYVELISIELLTKLSVCNDPIRTVKNSLPRIIDVNHQMACDNAPISKAVVDKYSTNVQNISNNLVRAPSASLGLNSVNSFLGSDITQFDVLTSTSNTPTTPFPCQPFGVTQIACDILGAVAEVDLHFIDAGTVISGVGPGRALLQTHDALQSGKFNYRMAISTTRSTLVPSYSDPDSAISQYYKMTIDTLKGFWNQPCKEPARAIEYYASALYNRVNTATATASGLPSYKSFGVGDLYPGNLAGIAISSIIRSNGFKLDINVYPVALTSGAVNGYFLDRVGLAIAPNIPGKVNIVDLSSSNRYSVLTNSESGRDGLSINSFTYTNFKPLGIQASDTVRFRDKSTKILCIYVDSSMADYSLNDSGFIVSQFYRETILQAIICGYKILFITGNTIGDVSWLYNQIEISAGDTNIAIVPLDQKTVETGDYSERLRTAINKLCGLATDTTPQTTTLGSIKEVWQVDSVINSNPGTKALTFFNINKNSTAVNTENRQPDLFDNIAGLSAFDPVFDRVFNINQNTGGSKTLVAIDLRTKIVTNISSLPFLQDNTLGFETNIPSAIHYDPGTRMIFIGTDSGRLFIVNTQSRSFSEISIKNITVVPKNERIIPTISGITTGFIPASPVSRQGLPNTSKRVIFIAMNVVAQGISNRTKTTVIRALNYDSSLFPLVGSQLLIDVGYNNDIVITSMAYPRSLSFISAPLFIFPKSVAAGSINTEDFRMPGLAICYNEWDVAQLDFAQPESRSGIFNPMAFSLAYSYFSDYSDTFSKFPITIQLPLNGIGADFITTDELGQCMILALVENGVPQKSISFYYVDLPQDGFVMSSFFSPTAIKLTEYKIGSIPTSIFVRNSLRCADNLKLIERTDFSRSDLSGWNYKGATKNLADIFINNQLLLKPGESISKHYENLPGTYYLSVTTSDYRLAGDSDRVNITGMINIVTTRGTRLHYLPTRQEAGLISDAGVTKLIQSDYNPTVITTAGTSTYVFDMPDSFDIKLINSMSENQFTAANDPYLKYSPLGAGIVAFKLCRLTDTTGVSYGTKDYRLNLKYLGLPRTEVNIFSAFVKVVYRNLIDPTKKVTIYRLPFADGRTTALGGDESFPNCTTSATCNYWKQNGLAGIASQSITNQVSLTDHEMANVADFPIESTTRFINCVWCIPTGNTHIDISTKKPIQSKTPDVFTIFFGDFNEDKMIVESIEYFLLMNRILDQSNVMPSCPTQASYCGPDPVEKLEISSNYNNCRDFAVELFDEVKLNTVFLQAADLSRVVPTNRWDYIRTDLNGISVGPPLGNAFRGVSAKWYSHKVVLDNTIGTGIDQCSTPIAGLLIYSGTSLTSGSLNGMKVVVPTMTSLGRAARKCTPIFAVDDISDNNNINEIQIVDMPKAGGGTFTLTFAKAGDKQTATIPYNVTAGSLKSLLEGLSNVGTGAIMTESDDNKIIVEFVGKLASTPLPLMIAHSKKLSGTYYAYTSRIYGGTRNERQTIANTAASYRSFSMTFADQTSTTLPYNVSLDTLRSALESLPAIGPGNVRVSGTTTNGSESYMGPWSIDFIGRLSGSNVSRIKTSNTDFSVYTDWVGAIGINETQSFKYKANSGRFTLKVYGATGESGTTEPIQFNSPISTVKTAILAACPFYSDSDIALSLSKNGNVYSWTIEYAGRVTSTSIPIIFIDSVDLVGDIVKVTRYQAGGGKSKKIKWSYKNALGGYYVLKFDLVDGTKYFTDHILFDASATDIEDILNRTTLFDVGDVKVTQVSKTATGDYEYILLVKKNYPSLKVSAIYEASLLCNPIVFVEVPAAPYEYLPIRCPDQAPLVHGLDGLVCVPFPPEADERDLQPCFTTETLPAEINKSTFMKIERDLFDPYMLFNGNTMTVGSLMAARNYKRSKFKPYYLRNQGACVALVEAGYNDVLTTRSTVVIITDEVIKEIPKIRIVERVKNSLVKKPYCGALPSQLGRYDQIYPDIMPGKNYNI